MTYPEIVGEPLVVAGAHVYSLGGDIHVPADASVSNLVVAAFWRETGSGASAGLPRVDTDYSLLTGASGTGVPSSMNFSVQQFRNLSPGIHRVSLEPATLGYFEHAVLAAVLLQRGGLCSTLSTGTVKPFSTANISATSRLVVLSWSYGASAIREDGNLSTVVNVGTLTDSCGAFTIVTATGNGQSAFVGITPVGEVENMTGYFILPYEPS